MSSDPTGQQFRGKGSNFNSHAYNGGKADNDLKPAEFKDRADKESVKLQEQQEINSKIQEDFRRRKLRYLKREQEYRRHIEELQRELRIRLGYEVDATQKNEKVIEALRDELHGNIDGIQDKIKSLKEEQEKDIVRKFSTDLNKLKSEIENTKTTKGYSTEELKDRENQLNQHLEVITTIAQRIENENRTLVKKNSELKKEYRNQENDRELLLKQLVMLKKENGKVKEEVDYYNRIVEEKKEEMNPDERFDASPAESRQSPLKKTNNRTLLNSRKSNRKDELSRGPGSMRQSTNTLNVDPTARTEEFGGGYYQKPQETEDDKIQRYERIIDKLKKTLDFESKNLKGARTQYRSEMNHKTELEDLLKE